MDYVFGTKGDLEILKTKGDVHTDLMGYHQIERNYPDQTITDNFRAVRKLDSAEDAEGNCYDWYEIDHHYRVADKTGPVAQQVAENAAVMEDTMCDLDAMTDARVTAVEDAICDLDMLVNGGAEA